MRSLRVKIAVAMAVLGFVATAMVGAVSYSSTSTRLVDEVDRSMKEATSLLVNIRSGDDLVGIPSRGLLGVYSVRLLNRRAEVANSSFKEDLELTAKAKLTIGDDKGFDVATITFEGERFRVHTVGAARGGIQVARSLGETDRVLSDLRQRTTFLVIVVSLLAAAIGWLLASTVAAPLRRLTLAAEEVEASGNLDLAVAVQRADEVGRLGAAFQSMLGALRRSQTEQQRLVQDAGHELRTPLTSLRTNLSVIRRHPDMGSEMQERILDDLDGEVRELTDLVNELVSVASGELADEPAAIVDLGALASVVGARVARRKARVVVVDVAAAGIVLAPPAGLERAMTNLIQNAAKFDTSNGSIEVVVRGGDLRVLDRGPGIPDEDLPLIFDRFHRAAAARTMPGSGLGLAIVREIVERSGGTVSARHRDGGGADVGFSLPEA
jgi:two-component system sensor histidine kinase MprB